MRNVLQLNCSWDDQKHLRSSLGLFLTLCIWNVASSHAQTKSSGSLTLPSATRTTTLLERQSCRLNVLPWTCHVRGGGGWTSDIHQQSLNTMHNATDKLVTLSEEKEASGIPLFDRNKGKRKDRLLFKQLYSKFINRSTTKCDKPYNDSSDHRSRYGQSRHSENEKDDGIQSADDRTDDNLEAVGVKEHKKANAVGDPDGDGSDSDDSDDETDYENWESLEPPLNLEINASNNQQEEQQQNKMQVEFELVEGAELHDEHIDELGEQGSLKMNLSGSGGGGVGVRLGNRLSQRRKGKASSLRLSSSSTSHNSKAALLERIQQAWLPHIYLPPGSKAKAFIRENVHLIDCAAKSRLDRRTLYTGLLMEWFTASKQGMSDLSSRHDVSLPSSRRKFLDARTSQALQSALSLATQPTWRKVYPRQNAIRMYDVVQASTSSSGQQQQQQHSQHSQHHKDCTLAMQETITMALAHSLGTAMVILDDSILSSVRENILNYKSGTGEPLFSEDDVKTSSLIQMLFKLAREAPLRRAGRGALISACMKKDLDQGLDDPFDDRATASFEDMVSWEEKWTEEEKMAKGSAGSLNKNIDKQLPLVVFLRTESSESILKSKSAVELLIKECTSNESVNLIVLGKGINAKTKALPRDPPRETSQHHESSPDMSSSLSQSFNGAAPWFGFSPHNQNASGQNDPEGSRRFNIFLARTVDSDGLPGILGAIAPPQAGNLFPHMMAMQARERLQHQDDDSPVKAELERWAQLLQQQMQTNGGLPLPPPQFFNASLSPFDGREQSGFSKEPIIPSPEMIQQTLQQAMSELLDRLASLNDESDAPNLSPDLHKAFAQVLRNENLRRGIAENLARAAPALSDPKCQGVMLSVYVPPPPNHMNRGKLPGSPNAKNQPNVGGGWFQKILNSQEDVAEDGEDDAAYNQNSKHKRARTIATAAAVMALERQSVETPESEASESKSDRNVARLETLCRYINVKSPIDPVRAKTWDAWISRERGAVIFRHNRRVLNETLERRFLSLQEHVGTRGAGSSLRQMLSVRDIANQMDDVIKCAIELEAAKSQQQQETPIEMSEREQTLDIDITLSQLLLTDEGFLENTESTKDKTSHDSDTSSEKDTVIQHIHPSSLETALTMICRISPSPSGGLSVSASQASQRSKDEIMSLAQDKHERALVSQVVSPQDIGVTYDMIGGLSEVKELLRQSITYPLKFPHLYSEGIAREAVKGVLLFGPPGTGKTMLAKAVATEGGASFLSIDASSVENKWLGESEKNAKAVFTLARRLAPCVIFIDEVDSLLSSREGSSDDSAHGTLTSVKTTMMSEWDGLNSGTNGAGEAGSDRVIVIGSTNRPFDLDEAVLRRFPRRILVDLPDLETRTEILEMTLAENRMDPDVNLTKIAERLEGYTGSDIKEVCREAVVQISHEQARILDQGLRGDLTQGSLHRLRPVTVEDFENALSKLKRSVSEKGREVVRIWEWNDDYGEIKKESRNHLPHLANMYL